MTLLVLAILPITIAIAIATPVALVAFAAGLFWTRRVAPNRIAAIHLRAGYCPSCGYDLEAIAPDANDLRTCPECGGVWKVLTK